MKRMVWLFAFCAFALQMFAQGEHRFDPDRFQADLEQYITTYAGLSPQDAAAFFPIYRDLRRKQRALFGQMKRYKHVDVNDEKACEEAITQRDKLEIDMKRLQQAYHERFMQILPASSVFRIIKAEDKFHRQYFKKLQHK